MNKLSVSIIFIFIFAVSVFSQSSLPEIDFQFWNDTQITIPLKKSKGKKTERISLIFYGTMHA
jgi:hypothetical protein